MCDEVVLASEDVELVAGPLTPAIARRTHSQHPELRVHVVARSLPADPIRDGVDLPRYTYQSLPVHLVAAPGRLRIARVRALAQVLEKAIRSMA